MGSSIRTLTLVAFAGRRRIDRRKGVGNVVVSRQFPGNPDHRHGIRPVGRDLEVEDHIGKGDEFGEINTHRSIGIENEDSSVIVTESQFAFGEDHPRRLDPTNLATTDFHPARQDGPREREGNLGTRFEVPGAAHDLDLVPSSVDHAEANFVGVRVRPDPVDPRHVDVGPPGLEQLDALNLVADQIEHALQFSWILGRKLDVVRQPAKETFIGTA